MQNQERLKRFPSLVACAGVMRVRFHDLRHSHASHALKAGVHPKVASERLGHGSGGITRASIRTS
jgi:integrase